MAPVTRDMNKESWWDRNDKKSYSMGGVSEIILNTYRFFLAL